MDSIKKIGPKLGAEMFRRILAENKNKSLQRIAKLEMVVSCFSLFHPYLGK